ncbi:KH domain-containing protein, partial [bacterium]|nr:KH domain-containing protein [bacterium]
MSAPRDDYAADAAADPAVESAGLPQGDELTIGQERVLELVSYVVVNLVSHPADVTVDILHRQDRDVYQVKVHPEDLGRVIGKGGQTARA